MKINPDKLERFSKDLISMAELVEHNVDTAVMSLVDLNTRFAYEVVSFDTDIDEMEILIDQQCLDLLGVVDGQGDGDTFRFLAAAMKINNDLERIGNQAVAIATQVLSLVHMPGKGHGQPVLTDMLERVEVMVRQSVEALLQRDVDLAWEIWEEYAGVEQDLSRILDGLASHIEKRPAEAARGLLLAKAGMALARVVEHTKDIAEEVIYMREGIIVKHHEREFRAQKV
jgi:phosphate transport system protein